MKKKKAVPPAPQQEQASLPPLVIQPLTDHGNARMLEKCFGPRLKCVEETREFLVYDGKRWAPSNKALAKMVRVVGIMRYKEAKYAGPIVTTTGEVLEPKEVLKWANKTMNKGRLQAMKDVAASLPGIAASIADFDRHDWLLNLRNGTLDLETGKLRRHEPKDRLTQIANANYDPNATCPLWLAFLQQIALGQSALIRFLQMVVGYVLSGVVTEQVLFLLVGKGANGKSTFLEVIFEIMGEYSKTTPGHTFIKSESRAIRNDLARLKGARYVSAVEINMGKALDEALVKRLTGGDRIAARFIGKEFFEFFPQAKFFLAVNTFPHVSGADDGIFRRIVVVPFQASFTGDQIDKHLGEKLKAERDGIMAWAVEGFKMWQESGTLEIPTVVQTASSDFRAEMDVLAEFQEDRCEKGPDFRVPVAEVFDAYLGWAKAATQDAMGKKTFGMLMRQKGHRQVKSGSTRYWTGLRLRHDPVHTIPAPTLEGQELKQAA